MALNITVNGAGTFTASMEEGPVSFSASLGAIGPAGPAGPAGVVAATAPVTYNSGTQTVGIDTAYFVRSPAVAAEDGQILAWDAATSRPDWITNEARTLFTIGVNKTGTTIAKGKAVYISGATGNKATIALAQANSEATSSKTIGITVEAIADNATGRVIVAGEATGLDTSAYSEGQGLYLSPTWAGGFAPRLPTQPYHGVFLGVVTRSNNSNGVIEVSIQKYQELSELSDVLLASKTNLDLLSWDSATSVWKNKSFSTLGLLTSATAASTYLAKASNLSDLANAGTARTNLGLGTMAVEAASDYLTKAGNLSGLASASTARTNLGLGTAATAASTDFAAAVHTHTASQISDSTSAGRALLTAADATAQRTSLGLGTMATETAANYALLNSPTFTGTPTLPTGTIAVTQADGNNTTAVATTAFVTTSNPDASTTVKGHVELATDAEAATGTSATLATTPSGLTRFGIDPNIAPLAITLGTTATNGIGASAVAAFGFNMVLGGPTSAVGYSSVRFGIRVSNPGNSYSSAIDFSRPVWISGRINRQNGTDVNSFGRYTLGKNTGTPTFSDPTTNAIGVEFNGTDTYLVTHNGTNLTKTLSSHSATSNATMHIVVYSDGAGNAKLFVNGSEVASNTAAPTTKSGTNDLNALQIDVENKQILTGSTVRLDCSNLKVCTA